MHIAKTFWSVAGEGGRDWGYSNDESVLISDFQSVEVLKYQVGSKLLEIAI